MDHQHLRPEDVQDEEKVLWGATEFLQPLGRFLGVQDLILKFDGRRNTAGKENGWSMALLEMLVDPMLSAWVPAWVVEQYERWNRYFRGSLRWALRQRDSAGALRVKSNAQLLKLASKRMVSREKRRELRDQLAAADVDGDDSESSASSLHSESDMGDDADAVAAVASDGVSMVREPEPSVEGEYVADGTGDWERVGVAARLSAAGAAPAASDVALGGSSDMASSGEPRINPPGYLWRSAVNAAEHAKRLEALWLKWKDGCVDAGSSGVSREELDPWQKFAHDIVATKSAERQQKIGFRVNNVPGYRPLRLSISG